MKDGVVGTLTGAAGGMYQTAGGLYQTDSSLVDTGRHDGQKHVGSFSIGNQADGSAGALTGVAYSLAEGWLNQITGQLFESFALAAKSAQETDSHGAKDEVVALLEPMFMEYNKTLTDLGQKVVDFKTDTYDSIVQGMETIGMDTNFENIFEVLDGLKKTTEETAEDTTAEITDTITETAEDTGSLLDQIKSTQEITTDEITSTITNTADDTEALLETVNDQLGAVDTNTATLQKIVTETSENIQTDIGTLQQETIKTDQALADIQNELDTKRAGIQEEIARLTDEADDANKEKLDMLNDQLQKIEHEEAVLHAESKSIMEHTNELLEAAQATETEMAETAKKTESRIITTNEMLGRVFLKLDQVLTAILSGNRQRQSSTGLLQRLADTPTETIRDAVVANT